MSLCGLVDFAFVIQNSRYKGGNYLLWLKNIGYAEDPGYIRAVIRVLRQI